MKKKINKVFLQNMEQINAGQNPAKISPILALDYGEKISGLAWSPDGVVVFPLKVVETKSRENLAKIVEKTYEEKNCQQLVIGLPISGDGTENEICHKIRNFAGFLGIKNIAFVNERNSSQEVFFRGKKGEKKRIDDLAAARILEYWLES